MSTVLSSTSACPFHAAIQATSPEQQAELLARAEAFDPFQDAYMANPSEFVRWAREQLPIFYSPRLDYWVVTRYATIKDIFRDPVTFSPSNVLEPVEPPAPEVADILKQYDYRMSRTLVNEDEPIHMARRRVLMEPFTPEHLREHEPMVRQLVNDAIDGFIDDGKADLVRQLCWDVPFSVALHFLGIDDENDREEMHKFAIAHTINAFGRPTPEQRKEIAHTVGQFWQFSGKVLEKMRKTPDGPGWMRYSIRQQARYPDVVTDSYLHSMMMAIIVAAHETTTFATANALKFLLENRSVWEEICNDPELICPAVEESLRHVGSIASWRRRTTREVEVEGVRLPAGARLLMVVHAANHDPAMFPDPDTFDIRRDNAAQHLSFGFGAHQCLGKNLARMEMQIIISELTRRLPHMQLMPQEYEYVHNLAFRGPQHLWVSWDPARNPERMVDLASKPQPEVRIGAPLARHLSRPLRVARARMVGEGLLHLRLESPDGKALPGWTPGAHIDIECGSPDLTRQYSLCGDPEDRSGWEVTILLDPNSRGGSAWLHQQATTGTVLKVRGPRNHFSLDTSDNAPLLFVAGGIGVTPIMTLAAAARKAGRDYQFHYSAKRDTCMPFVEELRQLHAERLHCHVSANGARNDFDVMLKQVAPGTQVYACGPSRMLEALAEAMQRNGFPESALHVELFSADASGANASNQPFTVELQVSGLTLEVPADRSLLEVLRANNIDVQSDCEEGLCGTCEVGVLEGEVDHRDVVLSPAERRSNCRMMSCCSRAAGNRLKLEL